MFLPAVIIESKNELDYEESANLILSFFSHISPADINLNMLLEIRLAEDKRSIGIEDIKELIEWNFKKSTNIKIAIIYTAGNLTPQAQNSLLKILEEPADNTLIVLITKNIQKILPTIRSRCILLKSKIGKESDEIYGKIEGYFDANYLAKTKIVEEILNTNTKNENFEEFLDGILKFHLDNPQHLLPQNMLKLVEKSYLANNYNINLKFLTQAINLGFTKHK